MIAALALLIAQAAPALPPDWTVLPSLPWRSTPRYDAATAKFVVDEVKAGRCTAAQAGDLGMTLHVDVALLVAADGTVRQAVPRGIGCATIEQYTAGLISRVARDNLEVSQQNEESWYRASLTYSWTQ